MWRYKINVTAARAVFFLTNTSPWELQSNLELLIHEKKEIIHKNIIFQIH